ncbi:MAG TPA: NUDIX domain-containing protein [Candidatus Limnocylindrales bacterium]|nr:NUDIX domain-containing protein [Candidatus Limnocylindrales bacterium]
MTRIVLVALVDRAGAVLLRLHGEQSAIRPNRWSLPGGPALAAEMPARAAARLLKEQTGLEVDPLRLRLSWRGQLPDYAAEVYLFAAATTATDADISTDPVPGAIARRGEYVVRFIPGDRVQSGRPFTPASGYVIGDFMASRDYRELTEAFDPEEIA